MPQRKPSSSSVPDEGRFPAGMLLGERYKILGLLGRGGMGEVYRAHDLKLEQQVALKFLPSSAARDSRLLERFRGEVRIARQVSHRNVCRVYDLAEIDGASFISMEYVDGEDLGSLLRRIGRLPGDKAIEFARKLCAGLAAAHEKGILHRDLKPSNIMIDGRGQILVMDFGLAAAADAVRGGDIRSGTPAYMAPEQKEGREVTVRSDIYSLGLVLAEMFTGQRASRDAKLNPMVKDLDPAVEKVIQRCLDPNPSKRPQSALDVARALPGGDPLAEALAAGDTPSPEMVAASEDTGALSVRAALACLGFIVAGLAAFVFWGSRSTTVNIMPMPYGPEVLEQKARDLVARLGYTDAPLDVQRQFGEDSAYIAWASGSAGSAAALPLKPAERRRQLAEGEPPEIIFYYAQSPKYLVPEGPQGLLTLSDPVRPPGAIDLWLDPQSRLRFLRAFPRPGPAPLPPFDWNKLFEAAGLDLSRWKGAEPQEIPPMAFDVRAAWTGTYPSAPQMPLRIEAAAWQGRPVSFEIFGPWGPGPESAVSAPANLVFAALLLTGLLLALRNLRSGRGDLRGARRMFVVFLVCTVIAEAGLAHHTPQPGEELGIVFNFLGISLVAAAAAWAFYIAVEPYVRRHWPQALIAWSRVLAGKFRDPLVGGHILIGIAVGFVIVLLHSAVRAVTGELLTSDYRELVDPLHPIGAWSADITDSITVLALFFLFVLLRLILRRTWITAAVFVLITFLLPGYLGQGLIAIASILTIVLSIVVSIRFGMLSLVVAFIVAGIPGRYLVTSNFSAFYAIRGWLEVGLVLAVTVWSFRNALAGRKVWNRQFLHMD
ncbi:MAG TPA: serine/threonine-protein kinase [Bryobacteraceae bacterium]